MLGVWFGQPASAADQTLGFRGNLQTSTGQPVPDGVYGFRFTIYQGGEGKKAGNPGGKAVWSETYNGTTSSSKVTVKNGHFSVQLGSIKSLDKVSWDKAPVWLSMNVTKIQKDCQAFRDSNCAGDGEMLPMTRISASPFALDSNKLGGKTADQFVQLGGGKQTDSSNQSSLYINKTGPGNLMQLQSNGVDAITLSSAGDIKFGNASQNHSIEVAASPQGDGGNLRIAAGKGQAGGDITIQGGDSTNPNEQAGSIHLSAGSNADGSQKGLVIIDTPTFAAKTNDDNCLPNGNLATSSCTFTSASINTAAVMLAGFSTPDQTATVPDPVIKTAGRTIFITAHDDSQAFNVRLGGTGRTASLEAGASLGLLWNGQSWTIISGQAKSSDSQPKTTEAEPAKPADADKPKDIVEADSISLSKVSTSDQAPASDAPLGSIYYDTSLDTLRCYEASGWDDCSAAPDEFVSLSPSYPNTVVRENGIGELITDTCASSLHINDGTGDQDTVCQEDEAYNYYQWDSDEQQSQTRSIFVSYKLPPSFKSLVDDSLALTARADGPDADVSLLLYRKQKDGGLTPCGQAQTIRQTSESDKWQIIQPAKDSLDDCDLKAGDSLVVQIDLTTKLGSTAYVSDLDFMISSR